MNIEFDYRIPAFMRERSVEEYGVELPELIHAVVDIDTGADRLEATLLSPQIPPIRDDCGLHLGAALEDYALRIAVERNLL